MMSLRLRFIFGRRTGGASSLVFGLTPAHMPGNGHIGHWQEADAISDGNAKLQTVRTMTELPVTWRME
jgi:hypothetical protein